MPVKASIYAVERSTFAISAAFTDEAGAAVVPASITWRLEDDYGRTINSRSAVAVTPPASTIAITLSGADLQILDQDNDSEIRRLIIEAVYASSLGASLSLSESYEFRVINTNAIKG